MSKIVDLTPKMNIPTLEYELEFPSTLADSTVNTFGGLLAGSRELTHGKIRIQGVDERILFGDAVEFDEGVGIYAGRDPDDGLYKFRAGDPAGTQFYWNGSVLSIVGFLEDGEAASDVNANATTIDGGKITAETITATQLIKTSSLITASAQIADAVITSAKIVSLEASKITSQIVNAQIASIEWAKINNVSIETADIQNAAVTNAKIDSLAASKLTAGTIDATTITVTNLNATNINNGTFSVGGTGKVSQIIISSTDTSAGSGAYLRFGSSTGSRMWSDSSNRIGINSLGSPMYIYVNSEQIMALKDDGQLIVSTDSNDRGMYVWGNMNVDDGNMRISGSLRVATSSSPSEKLWVGGSAGIEGNLKTNHHDPRSSNSYNLGGDSSYWDYVYADDYVNKSMGWYDDGVTLQDGRKVSDMEALKNIRPHATLKNKNGSKKLDGRSLPKEIFRQAYDRENKKFYDRDEEDRPYIPEVRDKKGKIIEEKKVLTDGESLTHMVSLIFGALKEVNAKVESLELEVQNLGSKSSKDLVKEV